MLKFSILATSAIAAIATAIPAWAQETPADQDIVLLPTIRKDDIVVTATGVPQSPEDIGQAVTVIDRQTIEQRQTVALSDLLATTPGVTVSRNGGLGALTAVRIRGAEDSQTLTLIDGVRVNDPSSPGGAFDFANLLAGSIDRVEVLRGPNSVPWGSQAIGGVVNVTTMQPGYGLQARGNVEYGSFDTVFANGGVSGKSGIIAASLNAGYLKTDGISTAASGTEPDGYRQFGATGRVQIALSDNISLDLRGYYAHSKVDIDGFAFVPPYLPVDDAEYAKTQELYGYAGLNAAFLNGRFKNRVAFTIADINRDNFDPSFSSTTPSFLARGRSERYQYQGDFQVIDQVRLVAGAEHETTRFNDGTLFKSRGVTSFYGEAILSPIDRLTITGGLRYDDDSAFGGHTTWGANAVYTLPTETTIRASYAEGFKAPTLYQLYGPFGLGNKDLKPETARSYDIGIEQKLIGNTVSASATWFHRDTINQIDYDPGTFSYGNIDRARAEGVEVALNMRPSSTLTLSAAYSFIDAKNRARADVNFGNDLARRPHQSISASIDWKTPIGLGVGATVLTVGDSFDDAANLNRLDGYTIVGLRADFPIGDKFSIYGRVDNLFDEKYTLVRGYSTPGRAAYGGIRLKFN
ncbi:TonB-dependent receptor plug domain-containing protein [Sphingomonas mali]|uniref:TonB-dependent receptor plug domain-containing protein n=1 Tax=Sphingomonas mali TaxID=40682 RepID=UPI00082EABC0|nr:TonB-dependent receptor [Sphingomonas mali]